MRCQHLVLRNGYWTDRKCSREATTLLHRPSNGDGDETPMCTQHAKLEVGRSAHWPRPCTSRPL